MRRTAGLLLLLVAGFGCTADDPQFADLDGKLHHPLDVGTAKANVLIFITTDCPIANQYSPEIQAIQKDHAKDPVNFYLVHVDPDLTAEDASKHAKEYGHTGLVIRDLKHLLVKHTGIRVTPEAVILGPSRELLYRGRIDNWYGDVGRKRPSATKHELRDAIKAVLAGQEIKIKRTDAVGCDLPPSN